MNQIYQYTDTSFRGYSGIAFDEQGTRDLLVNNVKSSLFDLPQRKSMIEMLKSLQADTGFTRSETLLADIQALESTEVNVTDFRIGEAIAEVVLQEHFSCRFYWNELRDARNPKGNKTGADLVGFIEIDNEVLFLFGEVKTSSEQKSPPQVMINPGGMEEQLKDLYKDQNKRLVLISYIQSKLGLSGNSSNFQNDFKNALKSYYKQNGNYLLYGVLVRDTEPDKKDLDQCYNKLKDEILEPTGLKLLAIYLPIPKNKWLETINGTNDEGK